MIGDSRPSILPMEMDMVILRVTMVNLKNDFFHAKNYLASSIHPVVVDCPIQKISKKFLALQQNSGIRAVACRLVQAGMGAFCNLLEYLDCHL